MKVQNAINKQIKEKEVEREAVGLPVVAIVPVSLPGSSSRQRSRSLSNDRSSSSMKGDKPGPACSKKGGEKSSRRGSPCSITSIRSDSAQATESDRKASRDTALGQKRKMDSSRDNDEEVFGDEDTEGIYADADAEDIDVETVDTEGFQSLSESEKDEGSDVVMEEPGIENRKRKRSGQNRGSVPSKRGRGRARPTTTGQYRKLREAKMAHNEVLKEEIALLKAKELRELFYGDLLSNMGIDLDNTMDDLKQDLLRT